MASKIFKYGEDGFNTIRTGMDYVSRCVIPTLGPNGNTVIYDKPTFGPISTKDGITIAQQIFLEDNFENMGAQIIKDSALRSYDVNGDGTTSAITLTAELCKNIQYSEIKNKKEYMKGINKAAADTLAKIDSYKLEFNDDTLYNVALTASNGDRELSKLLSEIKKSVGIEGNILIKKTDMPSHISRTAGFKFDMNIASPYFLINNASKSYENGALVFMFKDYIDNIEMLTECLNECSELGIPAVIISNGIAMNIIEILLENMRLGNIDVTAFDLSKTNIILTDDYLDLCELVSDAQHTPNYIKGYVKEFMFMRNHFVVVPENEVNLSARINVYKNLLQAEGVHPNDIEQYELKITNLSSDICALNIKYTSDIDYSETLDRIDDSLKSINSALEHGVVRGGGCTLSAIARELQCPTDVSEWFTIGYNSLKHSLDCIMTNILYNGDVYDFNIVDNLNGYDYMDGTPDVNMYALTSAYIESIIVETSVSIVSQLLSTSVYITDKVDSVHPSNDPTHLGR